MTKKVYDPVNLDYFLSFKCFRNLKDNIEEEKKHISEFIKDEESRCIVLPVFSDLFDSFHKELLVTNKNLFFPYINGVPVSFDMGLHPQLNKENVIRASKSASCIKQILLEYLDKQNDDEITKNDNENPAYDMAAKVGNAIHEILQRYFCLFGVVEQGKNKEFLLEEKVTDPVHNVTGHIDFIGNFNLIYGLDLSFIGEIKTKGCGPGRPYINNYGKPARMYNHGIAKIIAEGEPSEDHLAQANMYMENYGKQYELFYYCDRAAPDKIAILYKKDDEIVKDLKTRYKDINKHVEKKTLPKIKKSKDRCMFCRYTDICKDIVKWDDINKYLLPF